MEYDSGSNPTATCWSPECDGTEQVVLVDSYTHRERCFNCRRFMDTPDTLSRPTGVSEPDAADFPYWPEVDFDKSPDPVPLPQPVVEFTIPKARVQSKGAQRRADKTARTRVASASPFPMVTR